MKEFFDGSSAKDIFQTKLNSMMEKSNSDNPKGRKRNTHFTGVKLMEVSRKVKSAKESESEVAQSCPTLFDPMDCSPPGSTVHEIPQARILE